jgi:cytochrome c oxidase subunit II
MQSRLWRASMMALAMAGVGLAASPCRAAFPMNYLKSYGSQAHGILPLTWGMMIISVFVVVVITALLIRSVWRTRAYRSIAIEERELMPAAGGLGWLYVGVGVSTLVLIATAAWAMVTLAAVSEPPGKTAFTIALTGHQWWWQVNYTSDQPSQNFTTANEIHIPVGQPVRIELKSADVIHSFWVPELGGKTDLIPGQTNVTWIEAKKPGTYRGQCSEYCGQQHAHMALLVVASSADEFKAWRDAQLKAPPAPTAIHGESDFIQKCGVCHTVRGTPAQGIVGPDLSHLMQRHGIAAETLANNTGSLAGWISNPQAIKPGSLMPQTEVTPAQLQRILGFLHTLK